MAQKIPQHRFPICPTCDEVMAPGNELRREAGLFSGGGVINTPYNCLKCKATVDVAKNGVVTFTPGIKWT